jgi:hypothetical protein
MQARFDFTQRLEYSDNPDLEDDGESDFFGRTLLGFGLESLTKVQRFALNFGTEIEAFRDDEGSDSNSDLDATNSFVNLRYDRNTRNALIGLGLDYREADTSSDITDDELDADGNVIRQDSGTRKTSVFRLNGEVGREAPIGARYNWTYTEINYSDTDDADLSDQTRNDVQGQLDFRISPKVTVFALARYEDLDTQGNGTDREETEISLGADLVVNRVLTANVSLGYTEIDRSGDQIATDDGISGGVGLTLARPDGSWGVAFRSDPETNDNGRRSSLTVSRTRELSDGNLIYSFGVTGAGDVIGRDPIFNISYTEALPSGQVSFGLSQNVSTDDDNDERVNTALRANYDHRINSISSVGVGLSVFDNSQISGDGDDAQRVNFDLTYRHDLTRDWGLVGGYSYSLSTEDGRDDRSRNTLFVGLQRSFNWIP